MREAIAVRRVERELSIRGARPRTQKSYLGYIQRYFVYCREVEQAPDLAETVRNHLLYLREDRQLSDSTLNVAYTATRLLFEVGYRQTWKEEKIPRCKKRKRLPVALSRPEVLRLFRVVRNRRCRTVFRAIYSAGLRIEEARNLQISDIDSDGMRILIREGKGGKPRYVMLASELLAELREYWKMYRPRVWLFESDQGGKPICAATLQRAFRDAREPARLPERATVHSLRHSFATHLLEAGTPLPFIQKLMGHRSIRTTMIYLQIQNEATRVASPLDSLSALANPQHI